MTSAMLNWAKTKSAFKDQKNVKDAKVFTDLTPAKQKIIKSQYEKKVAKKKPTPKKKIKSTARGARTYQYTVYLPEDYSDSAALKYWSKSPLVNKTSGVELGKELTAEGGRPIFDKGTYHVFTAKKLHPIKEWNEATKGRPKGFVSETGKNYGYTGGIVKKLSNK